MRTTLVIPDPVYKRCKSAAQQQGTTISELVTVAIEKELIAKTSAKEPEVVYRITPKKLGPAKVDINDREQLYNVMEK